MTLKLVATQGQLITKQLPEAQLVMQSHKAYCTASPGLTGEVKILFKDKWVIHRLGQEIKTENGVSLYKLIKSDIRVAEEKAIQERKLEKFAKAAQTIVINTAVKDLVTPWNIIFPSKRSGKVPSKQRKLYIANKLDLGICVYVPTNRYKNVGDIIVVHIPDHKRMQEESLNCDYSKHYEMPIQIKLTNIIRYGSVWTVFSFEILNEVRS